LQKKTVLNQLHREMGGRMVAFGGWDMPLHYGSQVEEHHAVRRHAGMFDVSHMTVIDLNGARVREFLAYLLANDVAKLKAPGKALYSCMLREDGGVIDDLIVFYGADHWFRLVVNAATTEKDLAWILARSVPFEIDVQPRDDLAMIAVQGPTARQTARPGLPAGLRERAGDLQPFCAAAAGEWFVARTGYTGEDGFEVIMPDGEASNFWCSLAESGVTPCGLGARDTLRLEAGMNLYGMDMDETVTPLESGLAWTVAFEPRQREFLGRAALQAQRAAGELRKFNGMLLRGRGVLRAHQRLFQGDRQVGELTSGGFSPTLQRSIGLARLAADADSDLIVEVRGKRLPVRQFAPPFVRHGKSRIEC
jgi:aminomethyltransferase